mmetsp:Transcript_224/g.648  ORF Transcript_224/g.648 Transcript_224/m.648 type:complete len:207 (+) Transcript_224:4221-4841(+)
MGPSKSAPSAAWPPGQASAGVQRGVLTPPHLQRLQHGALPYHPAAGSSPAATRPAVAAGRKLRHDPAGVRTGPAADGAARGAGRPDCSGCSGAGAGRPLGGPGAAAAVAPLPSASPAARSSLDEYAAGAVHSPSAAPARSRWASCSTSAAGSYTAPGCPCRRTAAGLLRTWRRCTPAVPAGSRHRGVAWPEDGPACQASLRPCRGG